MFHFWWPDCKEKDELKEKEKQKCTHLDSPSEGPENLAVPPFPQQPLGAVRVLADLDVSIWHLPAILHCCRQARQGSRLPCRKVQLIAVLLVSSSALTRGIDTVGTPYMLEEMNAARTSIPHPLVVLATPPDFSRPVFAGGWSNFRCLRAQSARPAATVDRRTVHTGQGGRQVVGGIIFFVADIAAQQRSASSADGMSTSRSQCTDADAWQACTNQLYHTGNAGLHP